jgi:biopolymer transport protein ExbB
VDVLEQGMLSLALLGAGWVLWLLLGLSVLCVAVSLERAVYMVRDATAAGPLRVAVDAFFKDGDVGALRTRLSGLTGFESRVLLQGLEVASGGPAAVDKAMAGTATAERAAMERGLGLLATVGANAPFIGLFGTVLGIIQAFHDLSLDAGQASEAVMAGISEALVATAVGLLVAIPAVVLYNVFQRTVRGRMARADSVAQLVVARLTGA